MYRSFVRAGVGVPRVEVADCLQNGVEIQKLMDEARGNEADVLVLPELAVTGYSCGDLFLQTPLLESAEEALARLLLHSAGIPLFMAVGLPVRVGHRIYNCAAAVCNGALLGVVPKGYLPNYGEFYEKRWFTAAGEGDPDTVTLCGRQVPFGTDLIFICDTDPLLKIGVEICEDLWAVIPPSSYLSLLGATLLLNLSASNELSGKEEYRHTLLAAQSARTLCAYCYANAGMGESTTDMVFSGHSLIYENGRLLGESEKYCRDARLTCCDTDIDLLVKERMRNRSFGEHPPPEASCRLIHFALEDRERELLRAVPQLPFVPPKGQLRDHRCQEIFNIQIAGLAKRLTHSRAKRAVLGISGGLDSTLALLATVKTFDFLHWDRKDILGVTMPGFGTSDRTYRNATSLMDTLGIESREIPIEESCLLHFRDIGHDPDIRDTVYENAQARERTQILMDLANRENGLVVGTGDLSEIALGWSTYNGDHMSMYAINAGVPKTLIRCLAEWVAKTGRVDGRAASILLDICDTPVSPELLPPDGFGKVSQKTQELVGPYILHDFFLYYMTRYGFSPKKITYLARYAFRESFGREDIIKWMAVFYRRFFTQQFKRSCLPDGPKVGSVALSPRGDWRMPSDASFAIWLEEIGELERESGARPPPPDE